MWRTELFLAGAGRVGEGPECPPQIGQWSWPLRTSKESSELRTSGAMAEENHRLFATVFNLMPLADMYW